MLQLSLDRQQHPHDETLADKPSFEDIYTTYQGYVYQRVYALVQHREEAEDLTGETFAKAWQAYPRLHAPFHVAAWLARIATNTVIDAMRQRKRVTWQSLDPLAEHLEAEASADPQARYATTAEGVEAVLARMPATYRVTLLLEAQGYSTTEIASMLGIERRKQRSFFSHARQKFKQAYARMQSAPNVPTPLTTKEEQHSWQP